MQKIRIQFASTPMERFFIEKTFELLHSKSADTYRLRLNNPKSVLTELRSVIDDFLKEKLKNKSYVISLREETSRILGEENELIFSRIKKDYLMDIIGDDKSRGVDLQHLAHVLTQVILDNRNYIALLFREIKNEISRINAPTGIAVNHVEKLNRIIGYFFVELIGIGYSKIYLHRFSRAIFNSATSFAHGMGLLESLINKVDEKFTVIISLDIPASFQRRIKIVSNEIKKISIKQQVHLQSTTNQKIVDFFTNNSTNVLIKCDLTAKDYYSAPNGIKKRLNPILDTIHMGHSVVDVRVHKECAVIGSHMPNKASVQNITYPLDGHYKSSQNLYERFLKNLDGLLSKKVTESSLKKIYAGLRYLRLGSEASELENKLLNYWIGMEYMFSVYEADSYTLGRMQKYFTLSHANVYLRKLFVDFHINLKSLGLETLIQNYNDDLQYLKDPATYAVLNGQVHISSLLMIRANFFKEVATDPKKAMGAVEKHRQNIHWNLNRIYRVRNQIVHSAAVNMQIETITSHTKYYLVFILNSAIDFLLSEPEDLNLDGILDLEDFFIQQEVKYNMLFFKKKFNIDEVLKVRNPIEYLL